MNPGDIAGCVAMRAVRLLHLKMCNHIAINRPALEGPKRICDTCILEVVEEAVTDELPNMKQALGFVAQNQALASEFATPGTLKHFMLENGYMPNDEKDARAILLSILRENDRLARKEG